jgi:hypothetical protein
MEIVKPRRVTHTWIQHLDAPPEDVFPLLCPVRECEWVNGWDPRLVVTACGVAEPDCLFTTGTEDNEAVWIVTAYQPPIRIEFVKVNPRETVGRITIVLEREGVRGSAAAVTYAYTALSDSGVRAVEEFTAERYAEFMRAWELELNHFLRTGEKLAGTL